MTTTKAIERLFSLMALGIAAASAPSASADPDPAIRPYSAEYEVRYRERDRGRSIRTVNFDVITSQYRFRSVTELTGFWLRLAIPRPIVENSQFTSDNGRVTPIEFSYEDGTRGGDDSFNLDFAALNIESPSARTLDPGALQVQIMLDAARSVGARKYRVIDADGEQLYNYSIEGTELVETALGTFNARIGMQQRDGSSRQTLIWTAPELNHLPVRIEQRRNGETRLEFRLLSLEWLDE
ncbi:MAG: DUF3108 domain-containing protein [Gammaproteobacteria bacterium]